MAENFKSIHPEVLKQYFMECTQSYLNFEVSVEVLIQDFYEILPTLTTEPLVYFVRHPRDLCGLIAEKYFILNRCDLNVVNQGRWMEFEESIKDMYYLRMETFESEIVAKGKPFGFT